MNRKSILSLLLVLLAALTVGAASAQDASPRVTALPNSMLVNGDFEIGTATGWTITGKSGDKVKCEALHYGFTSYCGMFVKGSAGEQLVMKQVWTPAVDYGSGDNAIVFRSYIRPQNAGIKLKFSVKVAFTDGTPTIKTSYTYNSAGPSLNWNEAEVITPVFDGANVKKVTFAIAHKSKAGNAVLDNVIGGATQN